MKVLCEHELVYVTGGNARDTTTGSFVEESREETPPPAINPISAICAGGAVALGGQIAFTVKSPDGGNLAKLGGGVLAFFGSGCAEQVGIGLSVNTGGVPPIPVGMM